MSVCLLPRITDPNCSVFLCKKADNSVLDLSYKKKLDH